MSIIEPDTSDGRRHLDHLLENKLFARSEQLSRLLRFVVERHLEGRDDELKESVIGVEVFGRKPDYNPKFDPIVRTEARRLRARLKEFYQSEGSGDKVRIELPKGGYVPMVRWHEGQPATDPASEEPRRPHPTQSRGRRWVLAGVGVGIVLMAAGLTWRGGPLRPKTSSVVYDLYRRAQAFERITSLAGIESSIDLFRQSIAKDPSFAPAYAGIAAGYAARSGFDGFDANQRADMIARGWAAAKKAVYLDSRLADAQEGMAMMQAREAQWEPAERSFRHAIHLAPREILWRQHLVMFLLLPLGRVEQAIRELRVAEELDPLSPQTHNLLTLAFRSAGRHDEALSHCQKGANNDQLRSSCWAANLERQGKSDEAVRILEPIWSGHLMEPGAHALGIAYARAGRREDAERVATILPLVKHRFSAHWATRSGRSIF